MKELINRRYSIENIIGQGGMADVYLAYDLILKRNVAIKIMRSKMNDDPMMLVRFFREASNASKLSHRNIVAIYDVGEDEGTYYIVMEYVKGPTLKKMLNLRGALGLRESVSIMKQLSYAIKEAHDNHIIHRDIKPQNILIKADGTVKITDFGIAVTNDSVSLTHNEAVMGSAQYLPPETAKKIEPNECFDIYSMGIVFYEMLAGQPPYDGRTPTEIALAHITEPFPSIRKLNPEIPVAVENIIRKATAKDPEERYQNILEIIDDLEDLDTSEALKAKPIELKTEVLSLNEKEPSSSDPSAETDESEKRPRKSLPFILISGISALILVFLMLAVSGRQVLSLFGFYPFPNISAMEPAQAVEYLTEMGFNEDAIEMESTLSDSVESGQVAEASSEPGDYVFKNSKIILYVSSGPSYLVEDYTGIDLAALEEIIQSENLDFDLDIDYVSSSEKKAGTILAQSGLEPGTRIDPKEKHTLKLTVASFPTITIPEEILGMDIYEAKEYLNGFGAAVVFKNYYGTQQVIAIDPQPYQSYTQQGTDSVITIYH